MRLVFDTECTGAQRDKAHPFNLDNKLCVVGVKDIDTQEVQLFKIEYDGEPYGKELKELRELLGRASTLVCVNGKFDLNWLCRYGIVVGIQTRIFDCQLAYFILTGQQYRFPSLDGIAEYFNLEKKLDVVKEEYWDMGFDTDEVPWEILMEYLIQDLNVTEQCYHALIEKLKQFPIETQKTLSIANQDLLVLQNMEWNGFKFNVEKSIKKGDALESEITTIDERLCRLFACDWLSVDSGDQLSVCLYGGTILMDSSEEYLFTYKDGRTAVKHRKIKVPRSMARRFQPLEGSELAKEGFYATNKATLVGLGYRAKGEEEEIISLLILRSVLEKRRSTYYHGIPKRILKMNWKDGVIHGNLNQCVVISGRLSADSPNLQNIEEQVKEVFESRYSIRREVCYANKLRRSAN